MLIQLEANICSQTSELRDDRSMGILPWIYVRISTLSDCYINYLFYIPLFILAKYVCNRIFICRIQMTRHSKWSPMKRLNSSCHNTWKKPSVNSPHHQGQLATESDIVRRRSSIPSFVSCPSKHGTSYERSAILSWNHLRHHWKHINSMLACCILPTNNRKLSSAVWWWIISVLPRNMVSRRCLQCLGRDVTTCSSYNDNIGGLL